MEEKELKMIVAMEELGELIQAISKHIRYGNREESLCEEIADVELCLKWLIENCNLDKDMLNKWRTYKNERIKNYDLKEENNE